MVETFPAEIAAENEAVVRGDRKELKNREPGADDGILDDVGGFPRIAHIVVMAHAGLRTHRPIAQRGGGKGCEQRKNGKRSKGSRGYAAVFKGLPCAGARLHMTTHGRDYATQRPRRTRNASRYDNDG